uniref:Uncharacterized protein n=1 Tax=Arundo donax TaxID=35708 RepID=A0A0A8Z6G0_ARUDO
MSMSCIFKDLCQPPQPFADVHLLQPGIAEDLSCSCSPSTHTANPLPH